MWSRGLTFVRNSLANQSCRFSVAASGSTTEIDDFLHSINTTTVQVPSKNTRTLETATEFFRWLDQNPVKSINHFINAAQMSITVRADDQKKVFAMVEKMANNILPTCYDKFGVLEIVDSLRFLLQINPKSKVVNDVQKLFLEKGITSADLQDVPFNTIVMFIRYSDSSVNEKILNILADALIRRIEKELGNSSDLLAILAGKGYEKSKWFHNAKFVAAAEKLVRVMGTPEKCALLKIMGNHKQRNKLLLNTIVNSISYSNECLSVPQIVSVTSSCSSLTFYPPKIARKISEDLEKNSNVLSAWDDIVAIADAFVRMRMGDEKSWSLLVRWAAENVKQANVGQLGRFVSGLARVGEPSGKPLAAALKPLLAREKTSTPTSWLNIVYSLAYFHELDAKHADSVLNQSFVDQIMNSTMEIHDRLRKAITLLMISSAAKIDMQGEYKGPTVKKETFARFGINFDAKTIRNARQLKYSSDNKECDEIFLKTLFKIAPQDTHCQLPNVEECGAFVDVYVMPDPETELLVSTTQWGSRKPRPIFFYGWMQTKQNTEMESSELKILGQEQLGLRLIRANGYDPVVVFKSEFDYCATDIEKVNMLRSKIHKTF
ncbi:hypothetical protein CRE_10297 [Caenorhabditis remanei]|uniref:RAP domain-containing protein n=1 Tax=Caenorhabditis remanei TaxID=31234 RepID=E3M6D2_CAERE|nr:hypothetical protein CRE_10297 [Caenorhabditis remanei]